MKINQDKNPDWERVPKIMRNRLIIDKVNTIKHYRQEKKDILKKLDELNQVIPEEYVPLTATRVLGAIALASAGKVAKSDLLYLETKIALHKQLEDLIREELLFYEHITCTGDIDG